MTGDPLLALHMGQENNVSAFGMLGLPGPGFLTQKGTASRTGKKT
jgi:hypothetical protein